jgi:ASC-1-like (ASCH) protein
MYNLSYLVQLGSGNRNNKKDRPHNNKMNYSKNVSEPWFSLISTGLKTVEGRLNKGEFKEMKVGEIIEWKNYDFGERKMLTKIVKKEHYASFKDYLETEGLKKCLPSIDNIDQGLDVYYSYYSKEDEKEFGIVAIHVEKI